jgi:hypothetical protein
VKQDRVQLLQREILVERDAAVQAELSAQMLAGDPWGLGGLLGGGENRFVAIRRDHMLEDGFERLNRLPADRMRGRVRIQFIDEHGAWAGGATDGG